MRNCNVIASLFFIAATANADDEEDRKTLAWIEQIVLRGDFVNKDDNTGTRKWVKTPKLSFFGGTPAQRKAATQVVDSLNEIFKETPMKGIEIVKPGDPAADIKVHLVYRGQFPKTAQDNGVSADFIAEIRKTQSLRFGWIIDNPKREITGAVIGVASDPAFAKQFEVNLRWALLFCSGLSNTSHVDKDSFFYREGKQLGTATTLSEKDCKMIIWFYNHVPTDSKGDTVHKMFIEHWNKSKK